MPKTNRIFVVFIVIVLLAATLQPAFANPVQSTTSTNPESSCITPATVSALSALAQTRAAANQQQNNKMDVDALQNATPAANRTDTDGDGLYDLVEAVLGTDFNNADSDFDRLNDSEELLIYSTDPLKPDSNDDGLPDYFEVHNVPSFDLDNDGFPNAWDSDNDGDGVIDAMDMSPFSYSNTSGSFHFDVKTTGNVTYINFQLRPKDAYLLRMPGQAWDWRKDSRGNIKDMDDSKEDVRVIPMLELTVNSAPEQSAVKDYGILVNLNKVLVPLSPDQDYGTPVALRGRMFYPASAPLNLSADARLIWMVSGTTDEKRKKIALRAYNGRFVRANNESNGTLIAGTDSSAIGDWENFTLRDVDENTVALKAHNGLYVRADNERGGTLIANSTAVGDWEKFELIDIDTGNVALKAHNGMYVRTDNVSGTLVADSSAIGDWETFVRTEQGDAIVSDTITYGHYYEDFMLTGFSVEESSGSDVGLFYSADKNQTLEAGFVIAYDFVRNATTHVSDMPSDLWDHTVSVNSTIRSFSHQDEALMAVASDMTPDALQSLPRNLLIPIIAAFEDRFTRKDMDELVSSSGTAFEIDMRGEPIITTKTMKMSWYNTSSNETIELEPILTEMQDWGQAQGVSNDNLATMMSVVIAWNVGETLITRMGSDVTDFDYPEGLGVLDDIKDYGLIDGVQFIADAILSAGSAYYFTTFVKMEATATAGSSGWKLMKASMKTIAKTETCFLKVAKRVGKALAALGWVLEIGLALYSFFAMAISSGWSDKGIFVGTLYATLSIIFAIALYAISCIPIVGWIIAAVIILSDILTMLFFGQGWMEMLIGWIVDTFTDVRVRSEVVGLDMKDSSVKIYDSDNNGLDVGDCIEFKSIINGTVKRTGHGNQGDVLQSYVKPSYKLGFNVGGSTSYSNCTKSWYNGTHKEETYDVGVKLWPISGVNLPMLVQLTADYKTFYDDCWWFFGWHCDRECQTGTSTSNLDTLYFDVFPGTISEFVRWRGITPLDTDNDGLTYSEERSNFTSPWSFDTDGDGLSDKYELDIGTNPHDADTDRDGLNDKVELLYNTNHSFWDSDGDGLSDYMEINGWVITVNYSGFVFNTTVHSDPLRPDADGDGVMDEMEYFSFLNPLSKDTDGDGVMDAASPKYYTKFNFTTKWGSEGNETGNFTYPRRIAVDEDGYVYVAETPIEYGLETPRIQKFDANGTYHTQWYVHGIRDLAVGNGYVYVTTRTWPNDRIMKFDTNGTFLKSWLDPVITPESVAVGPKGNVYVSGSEMRNITIFDPDGGFINSWNVGYYVFGIAVDSSGYIYASECGGDGILPHIGKYDFNGTLLASWGAEGSEDGNFSGIGGVAVDSGSFVYVADPNNHRIQKFAPDGWFLKRLGYEGEGDGEFKYPGDVAVYEPYRLFRLARNYNLGNTGNWGYMGDVYVADSGNNRIQKFAMQTLLPDILKDSDGDGLTDLNETIGWNVTFTNATGTYTIQVSSEPLMNDADLEGLTDYGEFNHSSNPRDVDTDDDGLTDLVEYEFGTNILHYDTDGDGLDDGAEITFGSNPLLPDTDHDGLSDYEEFNLSIHFPYYAGLNFTTDPTIPDTDGDGLNDSLETNFSDPLLPDTDGDSLLDGEEWNLGTDPWNPDTDGDGLIDGHENFFNTNLTNPDSDNDGVNDSEEINLHLDPLLNDTDGDGLLDGDELNKSLNPLSRDSDGDGIPDSEDFDSFTPFEEHVYLAYDSDSDTDEFAEKLNATLNNTYLHIVSLDDLLANHSDAPYIVLVGRPDAENGTVGNVIHDLLADSGDILMQMLESDSYRLAVRYGVWNRTQTVLMLSHPYPRDHYRVLNILKGRTVTVLPDSATVNYSAPCDFFEIDTIDTLKATDSVIAAALDEPVPLYVELSRYNGSTIPFALTHASGLTGKDEAVGRYLEVEVSETVQNETMSNIKGATVTIYYAAKDLDRTGDGDADDEDDLDESTLKMYWHDGSQGCWTELSTSMSWVLGIGVNTTNVEIYGNSYEGYVWADVLHFSTCGLAGQIGPAPTPPRGPGGDRKGTYPPGWFETPTPTPAETPTSAPSETPAITPTEESTATAPTASPTETPATKPPTKGIPGFKVGFMFFALLAAVYLALRRNH